METNQRTDGDSLYMILTPNEELEESSQPGSVHCYADGHDGCRHQCCELQGR